MRTQRQWKVETVTLHISTTQQQDNEMHIDQADTCTSDLYEGIAPAYQIPLETLRLYEEASLSRGNFVTKLVEVLFPELFGTSNFYKNYSYNGGGRHKKLLLDTARKIAIRRYSLYFYPDLKKQESYQKPWTTPSCNGHTIQTWTTARTHINLKDIN